MASFFYQGHGSFRLKTEDGFVIYVDPYVGEGYEVPADLVLITHEHPDHNELSKVNCKDGCRVIRAKQALVDGNYQTFECGGVLIQTVPAYNQNHPKDECVGFVLTLDGCKLYAAGDTSFMPEMQSLLHDMKLDYAVLPMDGIYNMDVVEAQKCAEVIDAKHSIPVHMKPGALFDEDIAKKFQPKSRLIVRPGEEIKL
jgi:L-ascorbate metabolism protein UlaG (beta-lactamase superfamily)